jgi:solute carrier family 25 aspartate/glutamate transporter 12/13
MSINFFYLSRKPEGSQIELSQNEHRIESLNPDHIGGYKLATVTFAGLENKFGLSFPRYNKV